MTVETTGAKGLITWSTDNDQRRVVIWRHTKRGAKWQTFAVCNSAAEAFNLAHHLAMSNYTPLEKQGKGKSGYAETE